MQNFNFVHCFDTPYKNTNFDPLQYQFVESFLTNYDGFNNYQGNLDYAAIDAANRGDYNILKEKQMIHQQPNHKFLFGNYFDENLLNMGQDLQIDTEESKSRVSNDYSSQQEDLPYIKHEILSNSEYSAPNPGDSDFSETEYKNRKSSSKANRVSGSKKISKKSAKQPKRKPKKNGRMSERLKNIVKNYGKNCAVFAISEIAQEFLATVLPRDQFSGFKDWIRSKIPSITNIANFREMLLVSAQEEADVATYKKAFQYLAEIFVRDYAYNWIFHSPRINDVKGHIFARFKMLRRIRDPKNFTYIH